MVYIQGEMSVSLSQSQSRSQCQLKMQWIDPNDLPEESKRELCADMDEDDHYQKPVEDEEGGGDPDYKTFCDNEHCPLGLNHVATDQLYNIVLTTVRADRARTDGHDDCIRDECADDDCEGDKRADDEEEHEVMQFTPLADTTIHMFGDVNGNYTSCLCDSCVKSRIICIGCGGNFGNISQLHKVCVEPQYFVCSSCMDEYALDEDHLGRKFLEYMSNSLPAEARTVREFLSSQAYRGIISKSIKSLFAPDDEDDSGKMTEKSNIICIK